MTIVNADDHVLPRPVEILPDYANAKARRNLAEKLTATFRQSEAAANATADAVVDPSLVRKTIGDVLDPQVEEILVPGGVILGIRTQVWARRILPDPRNPRIGPTRLHPFAVEPGTGGEDSRFRPVPEPQPVKDGDYDLPELLVQLESRDHLDWASAQAAKYVLAENDWRSSIASQGVMEAVWLVPTTYQHEDGSDSATVLTTVEGSSRTSAVHDLLSIRSADVPYDDFDQKLRVRFRKLNEAFSRGPGSDETIALRCERVPALIIVGFRRHDGETSGFPTAVKSLVALRHVDPPKPWGEGPENESLADEVLDEMYRRRMISDAERAYLAGSCTKAQARAAHLSDDPTHRASRIVRLFAAIDTATSEAIRLAVTSQSTRKRITPKLCNELATALIVRSVTADAAKVDQIRRYMRHAYGQAVYRESWSSTARDVDTLAKEALRELGAWIANETGAGSSPGPASLELAVRAAYPLITSGALNADRGTANNNQPDRRMPGEVLDAMRRKAQGIYQLAQALRDFSADRPIQAVDEAGNVRARSDGSGNQTVTDVYLRDEFPPAGKVRARSSGATPTEVLKNSLADFSGAMEKLQSAFEAIPGVLGHDGEPLVESEGVDAALVEDWRGKLAHIGDDLNYWGRRYRKRYGASTVHHSAAEPDEDDLDSTENASYDGEWDAQDVEEAVLAS